MSMAVGSGVVGKVTAEHLTRTASPCMCVSQRFVRSL